MDTETGNAQKWVAPSSFQWGTYVLKSERDCVSNKQNVLDFAKKVQTKGVKGTFQTKARKHLLLVVAVVLGGPDRLGGLHLRVTRPCRESFWWCSWYGSCQQKS